MKGPEVEQLLTTHFMEEGLFQLINDRIGSWAGRLQKACEENSATTMLELLQGRPPGWWAWSLSRGFFGAPFVSGNVAPVAVGVPEIRRKIEDLRKTWTAKEAVNILAELCDLAIIHAHELVEEDWNGEKDGIDPAFF